MVKSVFHVAGSMYLQRLRNVSVEKKREQCDPTLFMYLTKNQFWFKVTSGRIVVILTMKLIAVSKPALT